MAQVQVVDVLGEVLQIARECPRVTATNAYVRAARMLCNKSRWLVQTVSMSTILAQRLYTLTVDTFNEAIGIGAMSMTRGTNDILVMTESYSGTWDPNAGTDAPDSYQYVPEGQFALFPAPNAVYPLTINAVVQPKAGSVSLDARLLVSWDYALQAGALAYLLALPRTPWTDMKMALAQDAVFRGLVNQAASSVQRGYNAGAATTDRPGDSSGAIRTRVLPI